jgi:hypothetical protein
VKFCRQTAASEFNQGYSTFFFKTACTEVGGGSGRRTDMTFLDFWSTSSALYAPDEGPKDAGAYQACHRRTRYQDYVRRFSALQKRSRNGCVTPQIPLRNTQGDIHTFISMYSAIVVSFMTGAQSGARLMRARVHLVAS